MWLFTALAHLKTSRFWRWEFSLTMPFLHTIWTNSLRLYSRKLPLQVEKWKEGGEKKSIYWVYQTIFCTPFLSIWFERSDLWLKVTLDSYLIICRLPHPARQFMSMVLRRGERFQLKLTWNTVHHNLLEPPDLPFGCRNFRWKSTWTTTDCLKLKVIT